MAKKNINKKSGEMRTFFTFPKLHDKVAAAVLNDNIVPWFNDNARDKQTENTYSTNIMGRFRCNHDCNGVAWGSKTVSIVIRAYSGGGYNALVFNQRCKRCNKLGSFAVDSDSYIERVAYRLRKWAGIQMGGGPSRNLSGPPHRRSLCEGCKRGYCQSRG